MAKLFRKVFDMRKRKQSVTYTGIEPGRGTSNVASPIPGRARGRRAKTPLGGETDQL